MFFFQQNPPLAFGRTMLFGSGLQRTLQAAHFSLAFSLLVFFFLLSVLKIDMTDQSESAKGHTN